MRMKTLCASVIVAAGLASNVYAEKLEAYREIFQVTWENDAFVGKDGGYTNGIGLGYAKGPVSAFDDETLPRWLQFLASDLPNYNSPGFKYAASYLFGQGMQTPFEIEDVIPDPDDFPYAGVLFWDARLHFIGDRVAYEPSLFLGIVGDLSGAEQAQKLIHKMTGSTAPKGWDYQLENEPIVNVGYLTRWRSFTGDGIVEWDVVPSLGFNAGNLKSDVKAGLNFRIGKSLGTSWAMADVLADREADPLAGMLSGSWYVSVGVGAEYAFNDLLVQGNTWKSGPGLDINHERWIWGASLSYSFGDWSAILNLAKRSNRSADKDDDEEFGSLSIAWVID